MLIRSGNTSLAASTREGMERKAGGGGGGGGGSNDEDEDEDKKESLSVLSCVDTLDDSLSWYVVVWTRWWWALRIATVSEEAEPATEEDEDASKEWIEDMA